MEAYVQRGRVTGKIKVAPNASAFKNHHYGEVGIFFPP